MFSFNNSYGRENIFMWEGPRLPVYDSPDYEDYTASLTRMHVLHLYCVILTLKNTIK